MEVSSPLHWNKLFPQEFLPKAPEVAAKGGKAEGKAGATAMTDDERRRAVFEIMRAVGFERGSPPTAEQIQKAKAMAKDKGMDPDLVAASLSMPGGRKRGEGGGDRGSGGGGGGFSRGGPGGGPPGGDRGFNNTVVTRTLYKLVNPEAEEKKIEPVSVRLGISDGFSTEVLEGLADGDTVVTNITMPGAAAAAAPQGGMQNPFSGGSRGGPPSSSGMRGPR